MSLTIAVRFAGAMPSPTDWQEAVSQAHFFVSLDPDFHPETFSGFLPAKYAGKQAGFEYNYEAISDHQNEVSLVINSDARETASAILAAAALCHLTQGLLVDCSGESISADESLRWGLAQEADLAPLIEEQDQTSRKDVAPQPKAWWKIW